LVNPNKYKEVNLTMSEDPQKLETYGVKVPAELKQKITSLSQGSGLSGRDFMEMLISNYEAMKITQDDSVDIKVLLQLEHHLLRIKELYVVKIKDVEDYRQQFEFALEEAKQKQQQIVANLNDQIAGLKLQLENEKKSLVDVLADNNKLVEANNELERGNIGYVKTISLYEDTLDSLKRQVEELKEDCKQYQAYQQENIKLKDTIKDLEMQIATSGRDYEDRIKDMGISHERDILNIQSKHTQELRDIQNVFNKEIGELRQRYDVNIENKSEQLERVRNELNVVKEEKYGLQSELKSLQVQMDLFNQGISNNNQ